MRWDGVEERNVRVQKVPVFWKVFRPKRSEEMLRRLVETEGKNQRIPVIGGHIYTRLGSRTRISQKGREVVSSCT